MSKTLVIAEKPSMAREIAKVLGANNRLNGALSGNGYVVTNAIGHLVEQCEPEHYNEKWVTWDKRNLPMIPEKFAYKASDSTIDQYEIVSNLLLSGDFSKVINACDAGREGELIFRLIYELAGSNLPIWRLWISSLTAEAIREGFGNLKPGANYNGLCEAAKLRQEADWLIGLNATRAQTAIAREGGGGNSGVYSLGRVQTPTLTLVVLRDREIEKFVVVPYFEIKADFHTPSGDIFSARLFDASSRQIRKISTEAEAHQLINAFKAAAGGNGQIVSLTEKEIKTGSPALFDLTLLQRTANERFGMTAAKTLEIAQKLYEEKLLTYPRTSSCYLSDDVAREVVKILDAQAGTDYSRFTDEIKEKGYEINSKKVNNAKVTDHHAIIPTETRPDISALNEHELNIYDLVMRRFLAAFYPIAEDNRVDVIVSYAMAYFAAKGKTQIRAGWRVVEREIKPESETDDEQAALPALEKNMAVKAVGFAPLAKKTKPPAKFTEALLLQAMETAGKHVKDEELREAMKEGGLGTPATRAAVIESLLKRDYLMRDKKTIRSTPKAREVVARLEKCSSLLVSPTLTGQWEHALSLVERGEFSAADFRSSVISLTTQTVTQILAQSQLTDTNFAALEGASPCPACAVAGRKGFLTPRSKDGRNFSVCSAGREICNYITTTPTKSKYAEKLATEKCPKCSGVMVFLLTKEKQIPMLKCLKSDCDGAAWLEAKAGAKKGAFKGVKKKK